jgi:aminoglycoside phosphotransferase (APT) family kinase protein
VTARLGDGQEARFVVKYGNSDQRDSFGHKGGVPYEAMVYHDVLSRTTVPDPIWLGNYRDPSTAHTWVVLKYLDNALHINKSTLPLAAAAEWIGHFHRQSLSLVGQPATAFLNRYDINYYRGWACRAREAGGPLLNRHHALVELTRAFEGLALELVTSQTVVIHGEFYSKNMLVAGGVIHPIDWESAALGAGEIDVATISEFWPDADRAACEMAYALARWPEGAPSEYWRRVGLARLYLHLRWLGDPYEWHDPSMEERALALGAEAQRMGLI